MGRWDTAQDIGSAVGISGVLKKKGFLDDCSHMRALERWPPPLGGAPATFSSRAQWWTGTEANGLYLCNRELVTLPRMLQGNGVNVLAVQSGVAAECGPRCTQVWRWQSQGLDSGWSLVFAEPTFIFSCFCSADCHGNATAPCGFSDGCAARRPGGTGMGTALLATLFLGEAVAQCLMSGLSHGFGSQPYLGFAAAPSRGSSPLETECNPLGTQACPERAVNVSLEH